jgi:hypothetical protein
VKWAEANKILPGFFKLNKLTDDLYNVGRPFYFFFGRLVAWHF